MVQKNRRDSGNIEDLSTYEKKGDYLSDLSKALQKDYGIELSPSELEEAADNLNLFLMNFL